MLVICTIPTTTIRKVNIVRPLDPDPTAEDVGRHRLDGLNDGQRDGVLHEGKRQTVPGVLDAHGKHQASVRRGPDIASPSPSPELLVGDEDGAVANESRAPLQG